MSSQTDALLSKFSVENVVLRAEVERLTRAGNQYMEEIERLRGIVQADLEEKAEAWGEVERLRAALEKIRDMAERAQQPQAARSDPELNAYGNMCRFLADIWMDAKRAASPTPAALWDRECVRCGHKWKDPVRMALPCPNCEARSNE